VPFGTRVNGEQRQEGSTKDMVFSFAEYLQYLTQDITLAAGDVISGGTCHGTAMDSSEYDADGKPKPGLYLKAGDVVEIYSPMIGTLRNRIVAKN
jgi:2-keto-4-pentenoate hydratase/2-oxohepta-3-ene-1,7-dioic acid hydratase in catechol pathway